MGRPTILGWGLEHPVGSDPWHVASWSRVERTPTTTLFGSRSGSVTVALIRDDPGGDLSPAEPPSPPGSRTLPAAARALRRALAMAGVDPRKEGITLCLALPPREQRAGPDGEGLESADVVDALAAHAEVMIDPDTSRVFEGAGGAGLAAFVAAQQRVDLDALELRTRVVVVGAVRPLLHSRYVEQLAQATTHAAGGGQFGTIPAEGVAFIVLGATRAGIGPSGHRLVAVSLVATPPARLGDAPAPNDEDVAAAVIRASLDSLRVDERTWLLAAVGGAPAHQEIFAGAGAAERGARVTAVESSLGDLGAATAATYVALACEMGSRGCAPARDAVVVVPCALPTGVVRLELDVASAPAPAVRSDGFGATAARAARDALRDITRRAVDDGAHDTSRLLARAETSLAAFESGLRRDDEMLGLLDEAIRDLRIVEGELERHAAVGLDADAGADLDADLDDEPARAARVRMRDACAAAIAVMTPVRHDLVEYLTAPREPVLERSPPRLHASPGVAPFDPFLVATRVVARRASPGSKALAGWARTMEGAAVGLFHSLDRHRTARAPADEGDGEAEAAADVHCAALLDALFAIRQCETARRGGLDLVEVLDDFAPAASPLPHRSYVRALVLGCTAGVEAARHAVETLVHTRGSGRDACAAALVRGTSPDLDRAIESLLERRDAGLTIAALGVLQDRRAVRTGRVAPHLLRGDPAVRLATARALGTAAGRDAACLALAMVATNDDDDDVREVALVSLARQGDRAAVERTRLTAREQPRFRLLELLALSGAAEDAELLFAQSGDDAIDLLGWYGAIGAAGRLCDVLEAERTGDDVRPTARARIASRALTRITGAVNDGGGLVPADGTRFAVPSFLETRPEPWRAFLVRADLPPAPRLRFGRVHDRRSAAREIVLGGPVADRDRAELEAAVAFRCGGAIPSPRDWLARSRRILAEMGVLAAGEHV